MPLVATWRPLWAALAVGVGMGGHPRQGTGAAAEIDLSDGILDRIDEIVAPGTELDPADNYNATPLTIEHAHLRRR